ncbi:putative endonuclease [Parafilimonas terrae]|uniref:Putative endonuclease n=2 Tax=Parafilimonas terrae TaxID=1465490 RepID=A0A1I5TL99_9BACT|nr:putative endonuclease [Parafilimonas terrae]
MKVVNQNIMTNKLKTTLYIDVTSNLQARIRQHKNHFFKGSFTDEYNLEYCVYYENFFSIEEAILREKQIKMWSRLKKEKLINSINPNWVDLWLKLKNGKILFKLSQSQEISPIVEMTFEVIYIYSHL